MKRTKLTILFLLLACVLLLTACVVIDPYVPPADREFLYFYGVEASGGRYYARVLTVYQEDPAEEDLKYVPLADEIIACFQPTGLVGAWNPTEYHSPRELQRAYQKGEITEGAKVYFSMVDGLMSQIYEDNYYEGNDVTGAQ